MLTSTVMGFVMETVTTTVTLTVTMTVTATVTPSIQGRGTTAGWCAAPPDPAATVDSSTSYLCYFAKQWRKWICYRFLVCILCPLLFLDLTHVTYIAITSVFGLSLAPGFDSQEARSWNWVGLRFGIRKLAQRQESQKPKKQVESKSKSIHQAV